MDKIGAVSLERLRQYGWELWDPIGLADTGCPRDEYDTYLLQLVGRLRDGDSDAEATAYLVRMEIEWMGLPPRATTQARAQALVAAVRGYLAGFAAGPLKVR